MKRNPPSMAGAVAELDHPLIEAHEVPEAQSALELSWRLSPPPGVFFGWWAIFQFFSWTRKGGHHLGTHVHQALWRFPIEIHSHLSFSTLFTRLVIFGTNLEEHGVRRETGVTCELKQSFQQPASTESGAYKAAKSLLRSTRTRVALTALCAIVLVFLIERYRKHCVGWIKTPYVGHGQGALKRHPCIGYNINNVNNLLRYSS